MIVAVEEIIRLKTRLAEINTVSFDELVFTENGKPIEVSPDSRAAFKFTGLSNCEFVWMELYKMDEGF